MYAEKYLKIIRSMDVDLERSSEITPKELKSFS
jgi:hypothetical protein